LIVDNGLKKMQAICAVMRKLLHAIHGMLKNQQKNLMELVFTKLSVEANS